MSRLRWVCSGPSRDRPALWRAFLFVPFAVPFVVHRLYQPINAAWTVKRLGCGCPPLDDRWQFNANHFNLILWVVVAVTCAAAWWWALRAESASRGIGVLLALCGVHCARESWF